AATPRRARSACAPRRGRPCRPVTPPRRRRTPRARARARRRAPPTAGAPRSRGAARRLDDDGRRLDDGDGEAPRLEAQLAHGLGAHERHDPLAAAQHLDLGHHGVAHDVGDDPDEPVARRARDAGRVGGRVGLGDGEARELRAVDDLAPGVVGARGEVARVDPAAHGVVADPEEASGLTDPKVRHDINDRPASAERSGVVWHARAVSETTTGAAVRVGAEDPTAADVLALLQEHLDDMYATSPPESVHALDVERLHTPDITFVTARADDGTLLGCGAL